MNSLGNTPANHSHDSAPDELDQLLAAHFVQGEELAPASGFAHSVMESIGAETSAPPPIAFPWRRALPGVIALVCAMAGFAGLLLRLWRDVSASAIPSAGASATIFISTHMAAFHLTNIEQAACWIAAATLLSLVTVTASMRLARGR